MGLILGVFIALGFITITAIISCKHMWDGSPEYSHMTDGSKFVATIFLAGALVGIVIAIIYACNRGV
jgi:cytochrome bd-type quinol oxidase subunit 1